MISLVEYVNWNFAKEEKCLVIEEFTDCRLNNSSPH